MLSLVVPFLNRVDRLPLRRRHQLVHEPEEIGKPQKMIKTIEKADGVEADEQAEEPETASEQKERK